MKYFKKVMVVTIATCFFYSAEGMAACSLQHYPLDASYADIQGKLNMSGLQGGKSEAILSVSGEQVCNSHKAFLGAAVNFTFLYEKLVQIEITRYSKKKPILVRWAESVHGAKQVKPPSFFSNEPNAQWSWNKPSAVITYSITSEGLDLVEYVQIQSKTHDSLFVRHAKELEKQ